MLAFALYFGFGGASGVEWFDNAINAISNLNHFDHFLNWQDSFYIIRIFT